MYLNSATALGDLSFTGHFTYPAAYGPVEMQYMMNFHDYREQQHRLSVGIPVMIGAQFGKFYFMVGGKAHIGLYNRYSVRSLLHTYIIDPDVIGNLEDMPNHTLTTSSLRYGNNLRLGIDLTASAEIGICLDDWMPAKSLYIRRGRTKYPVSYRLGMFADYGIHDINANPKRGMLLSFAGMTTDGDSYTVPGTNLNKVEPQSILATEQAIGTKTNSLVAGVKFTLLFRMSKKKKYTKPPRPRPRAKTVNIKPDINVLLCKITDSTTGKPVNAQIRLFSLTDKSDTILTAESDSASGIYRKEMQDTRVGINISRRGYIDYTDTLSNILSDTIHISLQPLQKNTTIILANLHFDTDKTVIRNTSAPSLEDMYQMLLHNPDIRVLITGHTDNVGSRAYNMRLSRGRAKAVYDEMVRRGIDPGRMQWTGRGPDDPIEDNDTAEGRAENRRVEFTIL